MLTVIKYAIAIILSFVLGYLGFAVAAKVVAFLATVLLGLTVLTWVALIFLVVLGIIDISND